MSIASINTLCSKAALTQSAHEAVKWAREDSMTLLSKPQPWYLWLNNGARSRAQPEWPRVTWKAYCGTQYQDPLCSQIKKKFPQMILGSFWVQSRRCRKRWLPQNEAKKVGSGFPASIPSNFSHVCKWRFHVKFYLNNKTKEATMPTAL